jgi:hypothetical protein
LYDILLTNKYNTRHPKYGENMIREKKVRVVYVRIRAARPGIKPTLMVPIPRAIIDKLNIVEGETFGIFAVSDNSFTLVRTKP